MSKKQKSVLALYAIVLVVYSLIFFFIPFPKSGSAWIMYIFTVISVALGCCITLYAFKSGTELKSRVYGYPVFRVGFIYTVAQLVVSVLVCAVNSYKAVPLWLSAVICIVILALALVGVILTDNTRDTVEEIEKQIDVKTKSITYFKLDIASLVDTCKDADIKKQLNVLADKLKYSDPVSSDELKPVEDKISEGVEELAKLVNNGDKTVVKDKIIELVNLLEDRNRRCKALKK